MARAGISIFSLFFHVSFFVLLILCIADICEGGDGVIKMKASGELLRFSQNSVLKIALFADLHFGEDAWTDWGPVQDQKSQVVMSYVLDAEKPDFVIFLGDLITANNVATINASRHWDEALAPTKARGIPWASILGNHDDMPFEWPSEWFSSAGVPEIDFVTWNASVADGNFYYFRGTTRKDLLDKDAENSFSFTSAGPKSLWPSVSNYALQVLSSDGTERVIAIMYFLDSGGGSYPEVISAAQVAWFQGESQRLNPSGSLPEIVFWHIPSIAYQTIAPFAGIHKPCVGSLTAENVAPQEEEWGIMDALTARKSVKAVFVGHNHGLDWCCPYKSLWLCFARHTGYGGYGSWPRGVRIIEIKENPFSLTSWIRMEDGLVHSKVVLSS